MSQGGTDSPAMLFDWVHLLPLWQPGLSDYSSRILFSGQPSGGPVSYPRQPRPPVWPEWSPPLAAVAWQRHCWACPWYLSHGMKGHMSICTARSRSMPAAAFHELLIVEVHSHKVLAHAVHACLLVSAGCSTVEGSGFDFGSKRLLHGHIVQVLEMLQKSLLACFKEQMWRGPYNEETTKGLRRLLLAFPCDNNNTYIENQPL